MTQIKDRSDCAPRLGAEGGFTLVEILVVFVVLALLAAIAIPAFLGQSDKAGDASAKVAARTAATAAEVIATQNDGAYSGANGVTVDNLRLTESALNGADLTVVAVTDDQYTLTVTSPTGNDFTVERRADGTTELTCTWPDTGGCPVGGHWGG
jgi:type IV pilus assembly protein PilA